MVHRKGSVFFAIESISGKEVYYESPNQRQIL